MSFEDIKLHSTKIIDTYDDTYMSFIQVTPIKMHSEFEDYYIILDNEYGLVKIVAISNVETNRYGTSLINKFNNLYDALSKKYGQGEKFDFLIPSSIWDEDGDYMMSLVQGDRILMAAWEVDAELIIVLQVTAESTSSGIVSLAYEYANFEKSIENKQKTEDSYF